VIIKKVEGSQVGFAAGVDKFGCFVTWQTGEAD
jgi:hypothetical protein